MRLIVPCVLVLYLATANGFYRNKAPAYASEIRVQVARLPGSDGARLPHKYSQHPNEDYDWERIVGTNAQPGDMTSFKAYASERQDFEEKMHVCKARTRDPAGGSTHTYILKPDSKGPCSGTGRGWEHMFSFFVAEDRQSGTERIYYATCKRMSGDIRTIYTRVSTESIDCDPDTHLKTGSFYAEVGAMACEPIDNPENAYREDPHSYGGILRSLTLRCQGGYRMNGPETLNCKDGHWDSLPPTCTATTCSAPPSVPHGRLSSNGPYEYRTIVTYICADGYELHPAEESIQCLEGGEWTQGIAQCRPRDCGFPGNIENGDLSQGPYTFGSVLQFSCDSGYALHGDSSATCTEDGQWSEPNPECREIRCGNLLHPEHGTLLLSDFSAGSDVIVQCHRGYRLEGSATMRCEQDGDDASWVGETPHCERITCEEPEAPEDGSVGGTDFTYDAIVTFQCPIGYVLRGSERAQCTEDGWDVETPTCEVLRCRDPGTPEHASREVTSDGFTYGTIVRYTCDEGSIMEGSQTLLCTEEGRWNDDAPTCEPVHCTPLEPPQYGSSDVDHFQTGGVAQFTCSPGYELEGPTETTCQSDGAWSHSVPECIPCPISSFKEGSNEEKCRPCPENSYTTTLASFSRRHCMCQQGTTGPLGGPCEAITCAPLSSPDGGRMAPCGNDNNDECEFDCEPGFYLQGSRIRKCTEHGWTGNPPICSECPENTYKTHAAAMVCIPCPRNSGTHDGLGTSVEACTCSVGYQGPAGGPCEDVDECQADDNGGCDQECVNTPGSFYCTCNIPGFEMGTDGVTCHKNRSCEEIAAHPAHGSLTCRYTEDSNGHVCYIGCEDTYFFVSGLNNYITCGSETDFLWSHQVMNRTARLPACTKEFFVDVDLPVSLQYSSDDSCEQQASIVIGHIKARLQEVVDDLEVCDGRCRVHGLTPECVRDQETEETTLKVDLKVMINNPDDNAVTPGCETMCQRQNMREIIGAAFSLKTALENVVNNSPDELNMADFPDTVVDSSHFAHGRPDLLCELGRVYTKNRLCVPCDAGFHHPDRSLDACIPCPIGTFQDQQGQTFCKPCLPGSTTVTEGADHPTMCSGRVAVVYNVTTPAPPSESDEDFGEYGGDVDELF